MDLPKTDADDARTGMSADSVERAVLDHLRFTRAKAPGRAKKIDVYFACAHALRDRLVERWLQTERHYHEESPKRVYYLSAEFLLGRFMLNNLINLGLREVAEEGLARFDADLTAILELEPDPGLGNGGLGRLAACFLDSLATLSMPAYGYGIRYEYGIFRQEIANGWQVERPDGWLAYGNPWEVARPEWSVDVSFGGRVERHHDREGRSVARWAEAYKVRGVPYDYPVAGYGNGTVNTLRLWQARASAEFDLGVFNEGDYRRAVEEKTLSESISKVLYPKDDSPAGRELRLKQQYFFSACAIADILRRYKKNHEGFERFHEQVAIQLNDTHPSIAIAELMRVLVDLEGLSWDAAWHITQRTIAYTNHTLLPEALERWPLELFERLLPRHLEIIYEINHRFLREVHIFAPGDDDRKRRMSIIGEGPERHVRMAHLAVVGSHSVNGVAALHSELVKQDLFRDFHEVYPSRFNNKTNGVTPRRWLLQCNPGLAEALTERVGPGWITKLSELAKLSPDAALFERLAAVKRQNKVALAKLIEAKHRIRVSPDSLFDVQVKRIHEYKRQLLNCLHVVALYRAAKLHGQDITPRTVIFAGKAAPGYAVAKHHIKLINDVASIINSDPAMHGKLACVFLADYNVSLAEKIIPAADLSEQISMAGKEASGTGNMKFQMNGALTIGTLDGANIEIREEVGAENFFLFGLDAAQASALKKGYDPTPFIEKSEALKGALELLESGFFAPEDPSLHRGVAAYLRRADPYLVCADFDDYLACQAHAGETYADRERWMKMVVANIAHSGKFSSDRTIEEYAKEIWGIEPAPVD